RRAPEKVVLQFRGAWMLEAEDLAALRIDSGHHVLDRSVLSGRIHGLEDQEDGRAFGRVERLLLRTQLREVSRQTLPVSRFRGLRGIDPRRTLRKTHV